MLLTGAAGALGRWLRPHLIERYGALHLTEAARPILRGERGLEFRRDQPAAGRRRRERAAPATREALEGDETASGLFQALRAARSRLARAQGVPPYVIFHDSTLIALASRRPQSLEALAEIPGMGERKIERYGAAILAILRGEDSGREEV